MKITRNTPSVDDFITFRADCGWGTLTDEAACLALQNGILNVSCAINDTLVGFGRVVGDGVLYFYLQDIIVHPRFRGQGVGALIVQTLLGDIKARAQTGATIGLMSAHGKEEFYRKFGFEARPADKLGAGMTLYIME